jgi:diguanylate cyclase (GGDEF)-like protein
MEHSVTSTLAGLEFLSDASQSLWRESSYDQLVAKFVEIAHSSFGIEMVGFYRIVNRVPHLNLLATNISFRSVPHFRDDVRELVEESLLRMDLSSPEVSSGINHFHFQDKDFRFVLLGEQTSNWQILVWRGGDRHDSLLDFLAKQLQCGCSWFARLDKTQALLYRDDLTGLFNIRYLEVALESEIRRAQRFASNFSLLFIDLDNFKMINDKFGHLAGSSILRQVARSLQDASREVDSVIRYGGDEFVILLLGANPSMALLAAERIRQTIEDERFMLEGGSHVSLTVSIGVASFPDHAKDKTGLLKIADETMYAGKRGGKNRVVLFAREGSTNLEDRVDTHEK